MNSDGEEQKPAVKEETPMAYKMRYPISIGIVLVIFGTIYFGYQSSKVHAPEPLPEETPTTHEEAPSKFSPTTTEMEATDSALMKKESNQIMVQDNLPSGVIEIEEVELDEPGYVVIFSDGQFREQDMVGKSVLLSKGVNTNVSVTLSKTTQPENTYYAVLYFDDGDKVFDIDLDAKALDEEGNPVYEMFEIVDEE